MNRLPSFKTCWIVVATFATALLGAGCDKPKPDGTGGGTIIIAVPTDVATIFPPKVENALDFAVVNSVYDRLADIGDDLNTVGDSGFTKQLAESWQWAPDSLSIAFAINPRARWHDGKPVRAEDVRYTFQVYTDTVISSRNAGYLSNIDSVSARDSLTAVVWFKRRMPQQFFQATYHMYVMPSHLYGSIPRDSLATSAVTATPIGSGRFRFVKWDRRQRVEIEADTGNYRGRAKLDRVIFAVTDLSTAALSVFSGDADFYEKLLPEDLPQLARTPSLRAVPYFQVGYSYLTFNLLTKDRKNPHPVFGDIRLRRALTMAVNRDITVRAVLDTFGVTSIGPSPRVMFRDAGALKQIPFDTIHARSLLDSAGWVLPAGKDVREKSGVPLKFDILVINTSKLRQDFTRRLEQQFRGVGAAANIRIVDRDVLRPLITTHDFDSYMGALSVTPGLQALPQSWGTRGLKDFNYGGYSNAKFDATIDSALAAFKLSQATPLWVRAFQQIIDDAPAIFLFEEKSIGLMHKRIVAPQLRADGWYADLADWYVDPAQQIDRDRQGVRR